MPTDFSKKLGFASLLLWLAIASVLIYGDRVQTSVEYFSLEDKSISPYAEQMTFEFNRSVDKDEMEKTFSITPETELELSWVGKKMVASFKAPLVEGQEYTVQLGDYENTFTTREKELFYIDSAGENRQILSYQLTSTEVEAITPEDLLVTNYQITADGNTIVFFGTPKEKVEEGDDYSLFPNLYSISLETSIVTQLSPDEENSLNMYFKLSPDGKTILLNRLNLAEDGAPEGTELLISENGKKFKLFWEQGLTGLTQDTIDFTSDSQFIVAHDWNRFKILPVKEDTYPEQDLGNYAEILGFTDSRNRLLFLKWKDDNLFAPSNELVVFDENGGKEIILEDLGVIGEVEMSKDGNRLVLILEEVNSPNTGIYLYETETEQLKRLDENNLLFEANLDLSLDEEWLSFESQLDITDEGGGEVWVMNMLTGEELMLTRDGRLPTWRP